MATASPSAAPRPRKRARLARHAQVLHRRASRLDANVRGLLWSLSSLLLVLLVTLLALFSEYAGVLGAMVGASRRYDGPMGKSDRAFVFGVLATGIALGWLGALWVDGVMAVVAALLVYTLVNRVRHGLSQVSENAPSA